MATPARNAERAALRAGLRGRRRASRRCTSSVGRAGPQPGLQRRQGATSTSEIGGVLSDSRRGSRRRAIAPTSARREGRQRRACHGTGPRPRLRGWPRARSPRPTGRRWVRHGYYERTGEGPRLSIPREGEDVPGSRRCGASQPLSAAAVDGDRKCERDLVARRDLGFQRSISGERSGSGRDQPSLDLLGRVENDELLLEWARKAAPSQVPARRTSSGSPRRVAPRARGPSRG